MSIIDLTMGLESSIDENASKLIEDNKPEENHIEEELQDTLLVCNDKCSFARMTDNVYVLTLFSIIQSSDDTYGYVYKELAKVSSDATIYVDINNYGGSVNDGIKIIKALKRTGAHIITRCSNFGYSMGAMIWASGDTLEMADHAVLMFHSMSTAIMGNVQQMTNEVNELLIPSNNKFLSQLVSKELLTEEEFTTITTKEDHNLYLSKEDMKDRITKYNNRGM